MTDEEKFYALMAQAENLQNHAAKLQTEAHGTLSAISLAVNHAGQKIRSERLSAAVYMLCFGAIIAAVLFAGLTVYESRLRKEHKKLQTEIANLKTAIQAEKATLAELESKTWRITLMEWDNGERGIILPEGVKFMRPVKVKDGRDAIVINP